MTMTDEDIDQLIEDTKRHYHDGLITYAEMTKLIAKLNAQKGKGR